MSLDAFIGIAACLIFGAWIYGLGWCMGYQAGRRDGQGGHW